MRRRWFIAKLAVCALLVFALAPAVALADESLGSVGDEPNASAAEQTDSSQTESTGSIQISRDGDAALDENSDFAISEFSRAQKGTDRSIDDVYYGYTYQVGKETNACIQLIATEDYAVCYVPRASAVGLGLDASDTAFQEQLRAYFVALDETQAAGSQKLSSIDTWYFTTDTEYTVGAAQFKFDQMVGDTVYAFVIGVDGSDLTDSENPNYLKPSFADFGELASPSAVDIVETPTGIAAAIDFLSTLDWSPLWVTLRTTFIAIVFIFILGLAAAYFCLNISQKLKNIFDVIFTIPMVLPPTVCGFILLFACGSNTAFGQFWINIGFPLIFSPAACVIAAVVVAFPLMYRNALGAFESLDPNMLDAARTLGWSNAKVFVKLMLPLSWSSIAAGTVLAFARALGEFGATLFMAGNYVGITRTIPIAIYFEWMNGNSEVAWFWTAVIIAFSFVVILFINLWSSRTTKYRRKVSE